MGKIGAKNAGRKTLISYRGDVAEEIFWAEIAQKLWEWETPQSAAPTAPLSGELFWESAQSFELKTRG